MNGPEVRRGTICRRAFTLVELLVVIGVIALLIGILLPALSRARSASSMVACAANLRQIGIGIAAYTSANRGMGPWNYFGWTNEPGSMTSQVVLSWDDQIDPYLSRTFDDRERQAMDAPRSNRLYECPTDTVAREKWPSTSDADFKVTGVHVRSYIMNDSYLGYDQTTANFSGIGSGAIFGGTFQHAVAALAAQPYRINLQLDRIRKPSDVISIAEMPWKFNLLGGFEASCFSPRDQADQSILVGKVAGDKAIPTTHGTRWNYLFLDGSVRALTPEETVRNNHATKWVDRVSNVSYLWTTDPND